jgi:hypothetical protein
MKKLWMATLLLVFSISAHAVDDRFNGYSTSKLMTWANSCAQIIMQNLLLQGYPQYKAWPMATHTCGCVIDHFREDMDYDSAMALAVDTRKEHSEKYTLMCLGTPDES